MAGYRRRMQLREMSRDRQIVEKDMETLYLGNLKTVESDLTLPDKGAQGSDIRWSSGEERFLTSSGKVTRPLPGMGNREVTLTGTFAFGEIREKKEYKVTILEEDSPHRDREVHRVGMRQRDPAETAVPLQEYSGQVRILPGSRFYGTQERMRRYLAGVDNDQMLWNFRKASGLDTKAAEAPGGWDAPECLLRGHTTGHYLSALALCYRATGDEGIRDKAEEMVRELGICQRAFAEVEGIQEGFLSGYSEEQFDFLESYTPYPEIWAPYYTLHKILAGLLDCYRFAGCGEALGIAGKIGTWIWRRLRRLPAGQLEKMWSMYIAGEFGGMNASLTELGMITGKDEYIQCARLFDNRRLFDQLADGMDCLDGLHANQHIPQIQGALALYSALGEESYRKIAEVFWTTVTENRGYATGGVGETEMFHGFREIGSLLTGRTQETCASYNMLKLTKELFRLDPDTAYMDYYERVTLNHILATSAADESGESTYFLPLAPGMKREFLRENSCCHGTGMESHFRYREGMYFQDTGGTVLYINLYIPSEISGGYGNLAARLEMLSRRRQRFRIRVRGNVLREIRLRRPDWADSWQVNEVGAGPLEVTPDEKGYLCIAGDFPAGMTLEVEWTPRLRLVRTPDMPERTAVKYGPYILAALSEKKEFLRVPFGEEDVAEKLRWDGDAGDGRIRFRCGEITWIPLCEIDDESYHVYVISPVQKKVQREPEKDR